MSAPFDPICLFETLSGHGVDYVVVGGMAAVIHGSPMATVDARIRTPDDPAGVAFDPHPALLATMNMVHLTPVAAIST